MRLLTIFIALVMPSAPAQWVLQESHTTASLRGIHNVGGGVAWASGSQGTVLRTINEGQTWQRCTTLPQAGKLDFRGIQAFDDKTAIIMSSGPGPESCVYRTTDGCISWQLVFANPDGLKGFFDAIRFTLRSRRQKSRVGYLIGDPVDGYFAIFRSNDDGQSWVKGDKVRAENEEALFAASNSSLVLIQGRPLFVTGGPVSRAHTPENAAIDLPLSHGASAGAFAVAAAASKRFRRAEPRAQASGHGGLRPARARGDVLVAVGGDYKKPDESAGTCAVSTDGGLHWSASTTPPHGYRSSVAYNASSKAWIAVGTNGTDISTDDGLHWRQLKPSADGADKNWNAISLPYVVGPHGRIGKLTPGALNQ